MNSFAIRFALVVVALVAGAWLAVGVRAVALEDDANAVLSQVRAGPLPRPELNAAIDDLDRAGRFSPDQAPVILQGQLLYAEGRLDQARAAARRATDAEPDNLQAWYLAWVVAGNDKGARADAQKHVLELNPWFERVLNRAQR